MSESEKFNPALGTKPLITKTCGSCGRPIGVMARFFQDQRKPWCVDCWLHGPANPAGQPEPDTRTGKLF